MYVTCYSNICNTTDQMNSTTALLLEVGSNEMSKSSEGYVFHSLILTFEMFLMTIPIYTPSFFVQSQYLFLDLPSA